ncbi:GIY-YIG nuclease family protein [Euryhalocaulis caribicus]|uniref:GIY-YIG nuclease family protein n=1 Tax=Euryhalocaulis caribicus TaxID=1161401 RepID=UPI000399FD3F|nr:GIY-YIG nuclease family protein [Euryhalocaulis caribicus]
MHADAEKAAWVYIMANHRNGTLYSGSTVDLVRRTWEHREGFIPGFTRKYGCKMLVWFEVHPDLETALVREKRLKRWRRAWKLKLIEEMNPHWHDLWEDLSL